MSHGDQLSVMPPDFHVIGRTSTAPYAAIAHNSKSLYGIQFHPEVTHSPQGRQLIGRFVLNICQCRPNWTMVKQSLYCVFIMLTAIAGGIYWQGNRPHPRDMWSERPCDWRSQRGRRQHCCSQVDARGDRRQVCPHVLFIIHVLLTYQIPRHHGGQRCTSSE